MIQVLVVMVAAFLVIAASAVVSPRLGIASPLVLVAVGVVASLLPAFRSMEINPEWILEGVLPPLLYSSAVSMPAMNFRREFGAISGLSVLLVVISSLALGLFFMVALPGLGFAWGVALGAIISPTDAVATSIIKKTSVSQRVVAILDGESLLNDATALVLLRTAIIATAATFSFWGAVGTFLYSVCAAVAIGWAVGRVNLRVRSRVTDPAVHTVISFTVPFVASIPAELRGASGLVAAVVAGVVTGIRAPRDLSPQNRLSDSQNWRTVGLLLEGGVFLTMGLQISAIVANVQQDHSGVGHAVLIAVAALGLVIVVRTAFVAPLLAVLSRSVQLRQDLQPRFQGLKDQLTGPDSQDALVESAIFRGRQRGRPTTAQDRDRVVARVTKLLADIDYFRREPLGWREGTMVVWAGMRGAVTVAAAQTLPADTPMRSVLVLVAFAVATVSLLAQGGTIGPLVRLLYPQVDQSVTDEQTTAERARLMTLLRESAETVPRLDRVEGDHSAAARQAARQHRLAVIDAQRAALLDARDEGTFDADVLAYALGMLDASQIAFESRGQLAH